MTEKQNDKDLHIQRLFHQIQFLKAIPIGTVFTMGEQSDTDSYHKDNKTKRKLKFAIIMDVPKNKLGLQENDILDVVNFK